MSCAVPFGVEQFPKVAVQLVPRGITIRRRIAEFGSEMGLGGLPLQAFPFQF